MTSSHLLFDQLKANCAQDWTSYIEHEFVRKLGAGTLPEAAFRQYLIQDYLFLIQFVRA
jgi:thiaminase/transcriptional activator TenA